MLEFIIGRAGTGKTTYCLEAIKRKLHETPQGNPLVILLPDHMTFAIERELALMVKDIGGFSRAYVLGMSRLAYQVLMRCGGALHPHLSEIGKELLLSRVLSHTNLSILAKAARQHHFTSSVSNIIEEFKTSGISADMLHEFIALIENETLKQKIDDLTTIYTGLNKQMEGRYHDSEDILNLAIEKLPHCTWLKHAELWIDGFDAFNPQHFLVIEQLLKLADNVHLTLCINNLTKVEHEAETALFHRQYTVYEQIMQLAKKLNIPTKTTILAQNHRYHKLDLAFIEQQLFKFPLTSKTYQGGLHIIEAANRRLECETIAADILRLCREQNYRYQNIGILLRDNDAYGNLLQAVFNDYNLPFFSDSKRQTAHHPLAELIRSSLEALRTWQYEPLFRAFKTDFFPAEREEVDLLENYVLSFGIRGFNRWSQQEDWQFSRSKHIDSMIDEEEQASFAKINDIRHRLIEPFVTFYQQIKTAETVQEFTKALYDFLIALDVPPKLEEWQKQAEAIQDLALAKEHQQIWDNIVELMDQLVQTCGSDYLKLQDYEQLINDGLDSIQIALIPPGCDYITIAPFEHNTLNNKKAIYILGANEKIMPRHIKNEGLLSDAERLFMASIGLNISSGAIEDNFAERYLLYKGFSLATDYLCVSYALADSEGASLTKSILITRLRQILPKTKFTTIPLETILQSKDLQVTTKRRSLSNLTAALRKFRESNYLDAFWQDVYDDLQASKDTAQIPLSTSLGGVFANAPKEFLPPELASRLYTKRKILRGSVTRFEQFFNCPFKHFAHYALNLQERQEFRFAAPDLGILLHAIMHQFGNTLAKQNRSWQSVTQTECEQICDNIIAKIAPKLQNQILLSSRRYAHLLERIKHLAVSSLMRLVEFAKHSEFKPRALEQNFGLNSSMPPLLFNEDNGYKIEITGQIDRIDITDNYFLVIDYKSGNAFINLLEVYYGLKLQLLTYLLVAQNATMQLCNMPEAVPAGILYCFLKMPRLIRMSKLSPEQIKHEVEKEMRMPGWVLADADIIHKIDDSLNFIKVRLNKDKKIASSSLAYVKTAEEFDLLMEHIEQTLKQAGEQILRGDTSIAPYKIGDDVACKFCPYIAICRFDKNIAGYNYREINKENDTTIIEKLKEQHQKNTQEEKLPCLGQKNNNKQ